MVVHLVEKPLYVNIAYAAKPTIKVISHYLLCKYDVPVHFWPALQSKAVVRVLLSDTSAVTASVCLHLLQTFGLLITSKCY